MAVAGSTLEAGRSARHRRGGGQWRRPRRPRTRLGKSLAADGPGRHLRRGVRPGRAADPVAGDELMYARWVLTALLAWPLLAGLVVLLLPARLAKYVALTASLVEFAISVPLWWTFAPAGGMQFVADHTWRSEEHTSESSHSS